VAPVAISRLEVKWQKYVAAAAIRSTVQLSLEPSVPDTVINVRFHLPSFPRPVNVMAADNPFQDTFNFQIIDPRDAPQVSDIDEGRPRDASSFPNSVAPNETTGGTPAAPLFKERYNSGAKRSCFASTGGMDQEKAYDEHPPTASTIYSTEWKVTVSGKTIGRDTEPDLVLAQVLIGACNPSIYE
jgi:hypothetical protein